MSILIPHRNLSMNKFYITISLIFLLLTLLYIAHQIALQIEETQETAGERPPWGIFLENGDTKGAVEVLYQYAENKNSQKQHDLAHQFGEDLYNYKGAKGLGYCTSEYNFGCYHEFLALAILEKGLSITQELNKTCQNKSLNFFSCQHGLGHGILTYLGYEKESLHEALEVCLILKAPPVNGCFGGVFMEYNMRTMIKSEILGPRVASGDDLGELCNNVEDYAKKSCVYWISQWWQYIFSHLSYSDSFTKMGNLCLEFNNDLHPYCFYGIGNNTINSTLNPTTAIQYCKYATQETYLYACIGALKNAFYAHQDKNWDYLCEELENWQQKDCLNYHTKIINL